MATILNILAAILFFITLISKGYCQCTLDALTVNQSETGNLVQNKTEWRVNISNGCHCTQLDVKLACNGFQTVEKNRNGTSVLTKSGDECLLNNGMPLYSSSVFNFTYAWDTPFSFMPISSQIACS